MRPEQVFPGRRLVFIDTETTGLDPTVDRILEIGVVIVENGRVDEWSSLLDPGTTRARSSRLLRELGEDRIRALPRFREVAERLLARVADGLIVAHNARFDYAFLKAEFERVGIEFQARVVCSLMLSRRLYGRHDRHDLASLVERHGLASDVRHRALPDAQALYQLWQTFHRDHPVESIDAAIADVLAGPVLPPGLDPALIDRLPDKPGVYVLHGSGRVLRVGRADNLRLRLVNTFRLDRISGKAAALVNGIENITWKVTGGDLGARLQRAIISKQARPSGRQRRGNAGWCWHLDFTAHPGLVLEPLSDVSAERADRFGMFQTERKARNALSRLADRHKLCRTLLGLPREEGIADCGACLRGPDGKPQRLRHLTQAYAALLPWKIEPWPYAGPIAIRERRDLHVAHDWRYLGTAREPEELHALLASRRPQFDPEIYCILAAQVARLPRRRIMALTSEGFSAREGGWYRSSSRPRPASTRLSLRA